MDNYLDLMRARREQILERFYAALDRAGRPHDAASLIAVSKTVGVDEDQCGAGLSRADSLGGFAASGAGDLEPCCSQD